MGIIVWLVMGGLVGWVASLIMGTDARQGIILNIVVGIIGAMIGGWLIGPMLGTGVGSSSDAALGSINNDITIMSFVVSLIGAIILLAILKLFQRTYAR